MNGDSTKPSETHLRDIASLSQVIFPVVESRLGSYAGDNIYDLQPSIWAGVVHRYSDGFDVRLHGHLISPHRDGALSALPNSDEFFFFVHVDVRGRYVVGDDQMVEHIDLTELDEFAQTTGLRDLYPFLRAMIARSATDSGLPQLLIPPLDETEI